MSSLWLFTASLGVLGASLVILASSYLVLRRARKRNLRRVAVKAENAVPRPMVRILQDRYELEEAVRRAAEFERSTASVLERRAVHYESLLETVGGRYRTGAVEEVGLVVDLSLDHPGEESTDGSEPVSAKPG
jgi:hypothetical protein